MKTLLLAVMFATLPAASAFCAPFTEEELAGIGMPEDPEVIDAAWMHRAAAALSRRHPYAAVGFQELADHWVVTLRPLSSESVSMGRAWPCARAGFTGQHRNLLAYIAKREAEPQGRLADVNGELSGLVADYCRQYFGGPR